MSTTPNEPQDPRTETPGHPGTAQPLGQGAVNGAPQAHPNDQQHGQGQVDGTSAGQQYGQAGGKYGTAQYNPGQYTGTMERPSTIDRLLKLTLVSLAISVLSSILSLIALRTIDVDELMRQRGADPAQAGSGTGQLMGTIGVIGGVIGVVVTIGLYLLVYFGLKKGQNWARVLGTIFAALAILSGIYGLFSGSNGMATGFYITGIVLGVVKIIVDILWIVTAYKAPTSAWFNQNRAQR